MIFETLLIPTDVAGKNGRIYPRSVVEAMHKPNTVIGRLGYANSPIDFEPAFMVQNLEMADAGLRGTVTTLDTEPGFLTARLVEFMPADFSIRSVGTGTVDANGVVTSYEIDYFTIISNDMNILHIEREQPIQ